MEHLEAFAEYIKTFAYWYQIALFACGALFGYILHIIAFKLRIRRLSQKRTGRNMVVIEPKNHKARKNKGNADYFQCLENAQYSLNKTKK